MPLPGRSLADHWQIIGAIDEVISRAYGRSNGWFIPVPPRRPGRRRVADPHPHAVCLLHDRIGAGEVDRHRAMLHHLDCPLGGERIQHRGGQPAIGTERSTPETSMRGWCAAASTPMRKSAMNVMSWNTAAIMRRPPDAPAARNGLPPSVSMIGSMLHSGRLPGAIAFGVPGAGRTTSCRC